MSEILTSIHGRRVGLGRESQTGAQKGRSKLISDGGFAAGGKGNAIAFPSPGTVALYDDFLGDVLADQWNAVETDTDGAQAVLAGGIGGLLRITTGNDDGNVVVLPDLSGVTSYLNWQAANGGLIMEARIKVSRITLAYMFIGFTDLITVEAPIVASGTLEGITTDATDAVGFVFDTAFATDTWHLAGVANGTDATVQTLTDAPVAEDFETLHIAISAAGVATFYRNGRQVGTAMTGAITPGVDLTPAVYASNTDGTSAVTLDVDYIAVSMDRAANGDAT